MEKSMSPLIAFLGYTGYYLYHHQMTVFYVWIVFGVVPFLVFLGCTLINAIGDQTVVSSFGFFICLFFSLLMSGILLIIVHLM